MSNNIKDIDDVDDDLFMSKQPKNYIFAETKKATEINERTTNSLMNCRAIIEETGTIGQSTLENLSTQRETLERVEDDLDNINTMTRFTQKNLNNMRSFFGGIKSIFGNSSKTNNATTSQVLPNTRGVPRSATIAQMSTTTNNNSNNNSSNNKNNTSATLPTDQSSSIYRTQVLPDKRDKPDDEFEANLSEIGFGLGQLKEMATRLGNEIGDQNEILDRITDKSERAGDSIKHQNRQMQQILKK